MRNVKAGTLTLGAVFHATDEHGEPAAFTVTRHEPASEYGDGWVEARNHDTGHGETFGKGDLVKVSA